MIRTPFPATGKHASIAAALLLTLCVNMIPVGDALGGRFYFYKKRNLPRVQLSEIGLSGSGVSVSENSFQGEAGWEGGVVSTPGLDVEQLYSTGTIVRKNILLWYYQYNHKKEEPPVFNVSYRILSRGGRENAFSHDTDPSSLIFSSITEHPLEFKKKNKNNTRCYGRVDMDFDIAKARKSGKYYGSIEITIITY